MCVRCHHVARLESLIKATQLLNSTLDLDELLGVIQQQVLANLQAARCTIYLIDAARGELWSRVLKDSKLVEIRLPLGTGIAGHVAQTGETVNLRDAAQDARFFADFDRRTGFHTRTMLCTPMRNRAGATIGVFQMLNKKSGPFTRSDEVFLHAFSDQVALAIENARHHQAVVEKERAEKELQIAARIQESLLPRETVTLPGYALCASTRPCHMVGGDYYAVVPLPAGRLLIVVADVAGKGVPAALLVSMLHAALHVRLDGALELCSLAARLNEFMYANVIPGRYITFFAGLLDGARHQITTVNAGHPGPRLVGGGGLTALNAGGLPLGLLPGSAYQSETTPLAPGDLLVLFSDGLTEAENGNEIEYGEERLEDCLRACAGLSADAAHARVLDDAHQFAGGMPLRDDLTLMVLHRQA